MSPVPITREVLGKFYDKYPYSPLPPEVAQVTKQLQELSKSLSSNVPEPPFPRPYRLDDCFWRNRQLCEEVIDKLAKVLEQCDSDDVGEAGLCIWDKLKDSNEVVQEVQRDNTDRIGVEVKKFLPTDFRTRYIEKRSIKKEQKRKKAVAKLVGKGGSVTEKYDLLLQHQAERRKALVELGECKGVFRWLIRYVAGVPKVLLEFAKEINAKLGPMEEQRIRFGPIFYDISDLGRELWVLICIWADDYRVIGEETPERLQLLNQGVELYCTELDRLSKFIGVLFQLSPWFVSPEEIERIVVDANEVQDVPLEDDGAESSDGSVSETKELVAQTS